MEYQDKLLFNTREHCRAQILRYLDYYKKENHNEIGQSYINSIAQYVGRIVYDIHGPEYFCDEIDVEILFENYLEYKNLDTSEFSDGFVEMLRGYMARRLQYRVNEFYRELRNNSYSVKAMNISSAKERKAFLKKFDSLRDKKPKIIRKV